MPSTVFDYPIFPGSKIIKKDITVTNTSGTYSETFTDDRISAGMQVNKMYVEDPSVFRSDISVQTLGGSFVFSCSDVVGTTDVTLEFLKIADDPNGITSTEFNILNNKIGEVPEGSNLQDEIDDINGSISTINGNLAKQQITFTKSSSCPTTYEEPKLYKINNVMYFSVVFNSTLPTNSTTVIGSIPSDYRPKNRVAGCVAVTNSGTGALLGYGALRIGTNGAVEVAVSSQGFTECNGCWVL